MAKLLKKKVASCEEEGDEHAHEEEGDEHAHEEEGDEHAHEEEGDEHSDEEEGGEAAAEEAASDDDGGCSTSGTGAPFAWGMVAMAAALFGIRRREAL